jgi:hypothetical protein
MCYFISPPWPHCSLHPSFHPHSGFLIYAVRLSLAFTPFQLIERSNHRLRYYELRRVSSLWAFLLTLLASISLSSAILQFNVTINHTHPSISYWPPTSWTTLTTNIAIELQNSGCARKQPSTSYAASVEAEREQVEDPRSFQITATGVTGPSKQLDNRRTRIRSPTYCRREGGDRDASDIVPQGHLDSTHSPIMFRFKFVGGFPYSKYRSITLCRLLKYVFASFFYLFRICCLCIWLHFPFAPNRLAIDVGCGLYHRWRTTPNI